MRAMGFVKLRFYWAGVALAITPTAFGHTDGGIHSWNSVHDLEAFYKRDASSLSAEDTAAQQRQETVLIQELLFSVTLKHFIPDISTSHTLKILDFIKKKSGVWNYSEAGFSQCIFFAEVEQSLSKQFIFEVLGLSEVNAETFLLRLENASPKPTIKYHHLESGLGYKITLLNPRIPYCYLLKHQDDLINAGIFNIKKFLPQLERPPANTESVSQ